MEHTHLDRVTGERKKEGKGGKEGMETERKAKRKGTGKEEGEISNINLRKPYKSGES